MTNYFGPKVYFILYLMKFKYVPLPAQHLGMYNRGLVSMGATGASAPAEIRQRVRRTRPEE